jgi:hypothetical protein
MSLWIGQPPDYPDEELLVLAEIPHLLVVSHGNVRHTTLTFHATPDQRLGNAIMDGNHVHRQIRFAPLDIEFVVNFEGFETFGDRVVIGQGVNGKTSRGRVTNRTWRIRE